MSIAATGTTTEPPAALAFDAPSVPMADSCPYETPHRLLSATPAIDDPQVLVLRWSDGLEQTVHSLTLRDHCPCRSCRHYESLERTLDQLSYPLDIAPRTVAITAEGDLRIEWPDDGHVSRFTAGWLRAGGCPEALAPDRPKALWGRELGDKLPRFHFDDVMADDAVLLDWLETLAAVGLVYVADAPTERGTLGRLMEHVAYVRETNFGTVFDVEAVVGTVSNAYTSIELPLHVDLPTREYQPGYQFLHCLANDASGGGSVYADGFHMAERLRAEDPEAFAILSTTPARHRYHDESCDYAFASPLFVLDGAGAVAEVRFNPSLITGFDVPVAATRAAYAAYRKLVALTRDPANRVEVMMRSGEIACMDNRRVLHGRRAFKPGTGRRLLQGAYLEREEMESRIRTLRRRFPEDRHAASA